MPHPAYIHMTYECEADETSGSRFSLLNTYAPLPPFTYLNFISTQWMDQARMSRNLHEFIYQDLQ